MDVVGVWDADSGVLLHTHRVPRAPLADARFSSLRYIAVGFLGDGDRWVFASEMNLATRVTYLWDADTGIAEKTLRGRFQGASSNGNRIMTTTADSAIVWEVETLAPVVILGDVPAGDPENPFSMVAARFLPHDRFILTESYRDTNVVVVWNAQTGARLRTFRGDVRAVSPDGRSIVMTEHYSDKDAVLWDVATGRRLGTFHGGISWEYRRAFSEDGKLLAISAEDGAIKVWNADSGEEVATFGGGLGKGEYFDFFEFVPDSAGLADGPHLVTRRDDGTPQLWHVPSRVERPIAGLEREPWSHYSRAMSPDGWVVRTTDSKAAVLALPSRTPARVTLRVEGAKIWQPSWSPDGSRVAAAGNDSTLRVWDAATGELQLEVHHRHYVRMPVWSNDGTRIFAGGMSTVAAIWDAQTGERLREFAEPGGGAKVGHFSPDGRRIVTTGHNDDPSVLHVWDAETGEHLSAQPHQSGRTHRFFFPPAFVRWSEDGNHVTPAHPESSLVEAWGVDPWKAGVSAWHSRGNRVATAVAEGNDRVFGGPSKVVIWDAGSGTIVDTLAGDAGYVGDIRWSPDGTQIAAVSGEEPAAIWDALTGERLLTLSVDGAYLNECRWSDDGKRLVAEAFGGDDRAIRVWDAATGQLLESYDGMEDAVFSPDGKSVVMEYVDGPAIVICDVRSFGDNMTAVCDLLRHQPEWEEVRELCEWYADNPVDY